jgi:tRNA-dihydrouridine synthase B
VEVAKDSEALILGNGDLQDLTEVYRRVRETKVDGVLLGRAAQGNPWIFNEKNQVKRALRENRNLFLVNRPATLEERFQVMLEHSSHLQQQAYGQNFVGIRKHLTWYCRGFRGAAEMRSQMVRVKTASEVIQCVRNYVTEAVANADVDEASPRTATLGERVRASLLDAALP